MAENNAPSSSSNEENISIVAIYSFVWTIKKFTSFVSYNKCESPSFYVGINELVQWKLRALPNGDTKDSEGYLSLYLILVSKSEVIADFKFSILNTQNLKVFEKSSVKRKFCISDSGWGWTKFIARKDILDKSNGLLSDDDKLTVACEIAVYEYNEEKVPKIQVPDFLQKISVPKTICDVKEEKSPKIQVPDFLRKILVSKKFSDVTLVVEDKEFQVHKAVLAARSTVFSAMFDNDMEESKRNRIDIIDLEPDVVEEMLHYFYTDETPNLQEVATGLLAAADKYDLQELKVMCEKSIFANLTTDNAAEILILADLHNSSELKTKIIDFICKHTNEMMKTGKLKSTLTPHPNLLFETFEALAIKKLEEVPHAITIDDESN